MSASFSLLAWLIRLPLAASCIDGDGRHSDRFGADVDYFQPHYYALAEDAYGSHFPYPKLPLILRRIFVARVRMAYWWTAHYHDWQLRAEHLMLGWRWPEPRRRRVVLAMRRVDRLFYCRRRGYSWHFKCALCGGDSFFNLAHSRYACSKCGQFPPKAATVKPGFSLLALIERFEKLRAVPARR